MVEAMVALTLADALLEQAAQCNLFPIETPMELRPNPLGSTAHREGRPAVVAATSGSDRPVSQRVDEE